LNDKITGVAGEFPILDWTLRARSDADHFEDLLEMVFDAMAAVQAGFAGLLNDRQKVTKLGVFEHARKIARGPAFVAFRVHAFDALKCVAGGWDWQ
jgi:hypothetical protein